MFIKIIFNFIYILRKTFISLPVNAQNYLKRIAELTGSKIGIVSVGPDRNQTFRV